MKSRFGPIGALLKRIVRRVLRFVLLEQRATDDAQNANIADLTRRCADLEQRATDGAYEANIADLMRRCADLEARSADVSVLAREIVGLRVRCAGLEDGAAALVAREELGARHAELAAADRALELRLEREATRLSARISELLRECERLGAETKTLGRAFNAADGRPEYSPAPPFDARPSDLRDAGGRSPAPAPADNRRLPGANGGRLSPKR